jgi:hypothetical protein
MKIGPIRFDKHTLGNLIKNVAPALAFTPLGVLGAGAAGALGEKLRGGSTGSALKSGLSNAAIGGAGKLGAGIFKGGAMALKSGAGVANTAKAIGTEVLPDAGRFRAVGGFMKDHGRTIADVGMVGERLYDRVQENKAAGQAQDRYRALQPMRDRALAELNASTPDTSGLFADPEMQNARYRRINVGSGGRY